jgi:hypothetical protein
MNYNGEVCPKQSVASPRTHFLGVFFHDLADFYVQIMSFTNTAHLNMLIVSNRAYGV